MGAKNRRKYLHKHPGPPFQIRGGPGSFSIANQAINNEKEIKCVKVSLDQEKEEALLKNKEQNERFLKEITYLKDCEAKKDKEAKAKKSAPIKKNAAL